jgi:hypothetical protein
MGPAQSAASGIDYQIPMSSNKSAAVDYLGQASRAYSLADQINENDKEKQAKQDQLLLQNALKEGGNMQTPDGVTALANQLKGQVAPATYTNLIKLGGELEQSAAKAQDTLAQKDTRELDAMLKKGNLVSQSMDSVMGMYNKDSQPADKGGNEKGVPGALDAFNKNKQASIQSMLQQGLINQAQAKELADYTPGQWQAKLETSKYWSDKISAAAKQKLELAQADSAAARAKQLTQGKELTDIRAINEAFESGEIDRSTRDALVKKAETKGVTKTAAPEGGVPAGQTTQAEKNLVVQQWIQNPSSLRGLPKEYQQQVIKWAADLGITAADITSGRAAQKFDLAAAQTAGHRSGTMASIEATMPGLIENASQVSAKVPRGNFVPMNKLLQMGDEMISDPNLKALKVATQAVASEYQQVIARGGTNVTALREAMQLLNTADSPQAYAAALKQVEKEVQIAVKGSEKVRASYAGKGSGEAAPAPAQQGAPAPAAAPQVTPAKQQFNSPADLKAAYAAKKIQVGDHFTGPDGQDRVLTKAPQ